MLDNARIYTLSSGPHLILFMSAVTKKRKNFEQIFILILANTACRQQMMTTKTLYKYFSIKIFQMVLYFNSISNQIRYYLITNFLETQYDL